MRGGEVAESVCEVSKRGVMRDGRAARRSGTYPMPRRTPACPRIAVGPGAARLRRPAGMTLPNSLSGDRVGRIQGIPDYSGAPHRMPYGGAAAVLSPAPTPPEQHREHPDNHDHGSTTEAKT